MNAYRITFENGNHIVTDFNGDKETALNYYLGKYFELRESKSFDKMEKCVKVEIWMGEFGWREIVK